MRRVLRVEQDLDLTTAEGVEEGERHNRAAQLVGAHLGRGEGPDMVVQLALQWNARCAPPLPEDELRRIVSDFAAKQAAAGAAASDWSPPISFGDIDLPPFPTDTLPPWLANFVGAVAVATQTPPDLPAMLALAVLATTVAKKVEVQAKDGYREPLNIYTVTALPPANRKSDVFADLSAPITTYEMEQAEALRPVIAEDESLRAIEEGRLAKMKTAAVKAKPEELAELAKEVADLSRRLSTSAVPSVLRLVADDSTPEKLVSLMQENDERMAILSPEGDVFEVMAGRYGTNNMPNIDIYLKGHAGDAKRVDRVGRPSEFLRRPALSFGQAVQPDVLHGLADKPGFRGRGLLGRFLYALPRSLVGHRDVDPPPVPPLVRAAYHEAVLALLRLPWGTDEGGAKGPNLLRLSPDARAAHLEFAAWLEPRLAAGAELGCMSDWAGKLAGAVARIAGLLHLAARADEPAPWAEPIPKAIMDKAIRIGIYLIAHATAAFAEMATEPEIGAARYVLAWLRRHKCQSFTERDLFEGTKGRFRQVEEMRPVLTLLVKHGFVRPRPVQSPPGPGRPPSPTYDVNPYTHSHNSHNSHNAAPGGNSANCANNAIASGPEGVDEGASYEEGAL